MLDFHLEIGEKCGANCTQPQWDAVGDYSTILFTTRAVSVIQEHDASVPLFMYLAYVQPYSARSSIDQYHTIERILHCNKNMLVK